MHLVAEEILRTLHRQGERQMPTEEAMAVLYEQLARPECPHLSTEQMNTAKILTLQFSKYEWTAERIVAVEERLMADIKCPDGETRTLTGSPDAIIADPPGGAVLVDLKFGRTVPPKPRHPDSQEEWRKDGGRPYLSERGAFQLDCYSLLVMRNYPAIERTILREVHIRIDELREATLEREELEHVERRLGVHLQRLELVLMGELEPEPRAGHHCHYCPRPHECDIPYQDRGEGAIQDPASAKLRAERWAAADAVRDRDGKALKGYLKEKAEGVEMNNGYVGWKTYDSGHRSFGCWPGQPSNGKMAE